MSSRREKFVVADRAALDVNISSGSVDVRRGTAGQVVVTIDGSDAADWTVTQVGEVVTVEAPAKRMWGSRPARVFAEVPDDTDVDVKSASADVALAGRLGAIRVRTASGDVRAGDAARFDANSASGVVSVGSVASVASCTTASGDVDIRSVSGRLTVSTASGDVRVASATDDVQIGTASGDVRVDRYDGSSLAVKAISGDVTIGLPAGIRVEPDFATLSGRTTLPTPVASPTLVGDRRVVHVRLKTISGNITVVRV